MSYRFQRNTYIRRAGFLIFLFMVVYISICMVIISHICLHILLFLPSQI